MSDHQKRVRLTVGMAKAILADPEKGTERFARALMQVYGWGVLTGLVAGLLLGWWL